MKLDKGLNQVALDIKNILLQARQDAYKATASAMIDAYWHIGKRIVEEEQAGADRAIYGSNLINQLAEELGRGFSARSLRDFRQFYQTFSDLKDLAHMCANLNWSHFRLIMRIENEQARNYYLKEATVQNWSVRTLDRNISTLYYQRLISSQKKSILQEEMEQQTADLKQNPDDFIRNPAVLDFLNLPTSKSYTEQELEQSLIDNLQQFLLELGKGFSFVARQKLIRTETSEFYIDLVFYNYMLKCFVLVELKTHRITHQDIGQLDMYVRMFDDLERPEGDNPTIGILLCTETDSTIAKYSVLNESKQLFANKYLPYLPSEEELVAEIEREKLFIKQQLGK